MSEHCERALAAFPDSTPSKGSKLQADFGPWHCCQANCCCWCHQGCMELQICIRSLFFMASASWVPRESKLSLCFCSCRIAARFFLAEVNRGSKTILIKPCFSKSKRWSNFWGLLSPSANCWSESIQRTWIPVSSVLSRIDKTSMAVLRSSSWSPLDWILHMASYRFLQSRIRTEGIWRIAASTWWGSNFSLLNHSRITCFKNSWLSVVLEAICTSADVDERPTLPSFLLCQLTKENSLRWPSRNFRSARTVSWPPWDEPSALQDQLASE